MPGAVAYLLNLLPPRRASVVLALTVTVLAVVAAGLVGEITYPLLAHTDLALVRWSLLVTAALLAVPISAAALWMHVEAREKKQEHATRESLLGAARRYAKQGSWEFDLTTGQFLMSDTIHQSLGDPERRLRLTIPVLMEMAHPDDRDRLQAGMERMLAQGTPEEMECRITGLDGKVRTFWVIGTRLLARDGAPAKAFGISQDITERSAIEAALRESEDHYRHMVELSPFLPWVEDAQGNTLELSHRWSELTGLPVEASLGRGWTESIHPEDLATTETTWQDALRTGKPHDVEHRVRVADGSYRWFRSRASARKNDKGEIIRWYGSVEDIHDRKSAEIALRESEVFASSVLASTTESVSVLDLEGRLLYMNPAGLASLGIENFDQLSGQDWVARWPEDEQRKVEQALSVARLGVVGHFTGRGWTARGATIWWDVYVSPILGPEGRPVRLLATSRDITAIKDAQDEVERAKEAAECAARHDCLTGLPNRSYIREQIERRLKDARSVGRSALLFLDLDEFKSVNDTLGHPAGDQLLRDAAMRLRSCLRASDLIARLGGDEFAILQGDVKGPEQIESLARRIIGCLSEPYLLEGRQVVVGVSIGIAVPDAPGVSPDDLLKRADIALYKAKGDGRGVYRFFEPGLEEATKKTQTLRADLREALARGEFRVVYQPVVEFGNLHVTGFEALLRWRHPQRGLLSPGEFIALAEESGAIEEIGTWVLKEACSTAASWPDEISVSVNLSSRQFRNGKLAEAVSAALLGSGLADQRLQLEITESLLLQDDETVRRTMRDLRALGVKLSIDDFGTGYSSLGYLRQFDVDNIKIDRSFVADLADSPRTAAILQAVMALAQQLGVSVTAEGVETEAQLGRLKELNCLHGQGYLFSRPMPVEKVDWFISRSQASAAVRQKKRHAERRWNQRSLAYNA